MTNRLSRDKVSGDEISNVHRDGEILIRSDRRSVRRERELARGHSSLRCDDSHHGRVARTSLDLGAVRERLEQRERFVSFVIR